MFSHTLHGGANTDNAMSELSVVVVPLQSGSGGHKTIAKSVTEKS